MVMAMRWDLEDRDGVGVVHLGGYLGRSALGRLDGAIDWALRRGDGPVVIDVTGLLGCSPAGASAIWDAARRVAGRHRAVAISGLGADPVLRCVRDHPDRGAPVGVHADLGSALTAARHRPMPGM